MSKKKTQSRRRVAAASPRGELENLLFGSPGKKIITAAAVLTAGLYLLGMFKPVLDSGPLPVPARKEVTDLKTDIDANLKSIKGGLDATLETAKAANVAAQSALQSAQNARLDRLIQQKTQLEALLAMNPRDLTLQAALERTKIDIASLSVAQAPTATVQVLVPK